MLDAIFTRRKEYARASSGDFPSSRAQVTGLSGRTPVSIPQGGVTPVTARAARKKQAPTAWRRRPSRWKSPPERGS